MYRYLLPAICFLIWESTFAVDKIKVACVGNSVTYGTGVMDRENNSYPIRLSRMLGEEYNVRNFSKPGATLLNKGHRPYMRQREFKDALAFAPDWVVIHLGLNDTDPRNWPNYRDEFIPNYLALIDSFRTVRPGCKVWICRLSPIFHWHSRFKSGTRDWYWQIQADIEKIAKITNVGLIDLQSTLYSRPDLMPDALHPNTEGAEILARTIYAGITGDYGGLQLSKVYGDNMVLQQGETLTIKGVANAGEKITVRLGKLKAYGTANAAGEWQAILKNPETGGPYELTVSSANRELHFKNVMIGEVWLCSGQSNMAFMVKETINADEIMRNVGETSVRLFNMKPKVVTNSMSWDTAALRALNSLDYYKEADWAIPEKDAVENFSAVAYCFGKMLADSLNVPVGLICNAIGGAPAEAFIDRKSLEFNDRLVDILYNWRSNDMIQEWVRERASQNVKNSSTKNQRHPYEPCYLFETGIRPLMNFEVKGVVWYQGESNAHNIELHEAIFPTLINSWRNFWGKELPFYYTQLSSINRPSWPHFRDSQRRMLAQIDNCGMAVSSDLGDPTDVHPKYKKEIGERLALWALHDTYGKNHLVPSGPLYKKVVFKERTAILEFEHGKGMKTSDGKPLREFEIAGEDGLFYPATAIIKKDRVELSSPRVKAPKEVRYGWFPYSTANLVNENGLPASTFRTSN